MDPPRSWPLIAVVVIACVLVVALTLQKRTLAERAQAIQRRANQPYPGLYLPDLSVPTLTGDTVHLGTSRAGWPQLLFVFNTTCEYCLASLPAWRDVAARVGSHAEVYGVSLHDADLTRAYADMHDLAFPIVLMSDRRSRALYRARSVPQSVVLDATGLVRYARTGAVIDPATVDSIVAAAWEAAAVPDTSTVGGTDAQDP